MPRNVASRSRTATRMAMHGNYLRNNSDFDNRRQSNRLSRPTRVNQPALGETEIPITTLPGHPYP
ncbi:hypothetical protein D3OALGB2SA_2071 [Olavius algarvensis associated proteobacterium Delta 3]|nr:hypothetical protein D3OALGB2SA_2071 [Olavius algarvensis associated proteobacterium Delta 3]